MYRIEALPADAFAHLFAMTDEALEAAGARRVIADETPGYPCRVSLEDAGIGESLVLVNHRHIEASSPYAASHAVFVRAGAVQARPGPGEVPFMLLDRLRSVRGFDARFMMREADVIEGRELDARLRAMLSNDAIAFVDIHFAKPSCFAARAGRASVTR